MPAGGSDRTTRRPATPGRRCHERHGPSPVGHEGSSMTIRPAVPRSIDDYIGTFPQDVQRKLQRIRRTIRRAAPQAEEAIRYQIPTFILHGNLISFAAYRHHIGLYPVPEGSAAFHRQIAAYRRPGAHFAYPWRSRSRTA